MVAKLCFVVKGECVAVVLLGSCWLIDDLPEKVPVHTLTAEMNRILTWVTPNSHGYARQI